MKILFVGVGGVGGYFGGMMAYHFRNSHKVEIYFMARGEHLDRIKANGLIIKKGEMQINAKPKIASENAKDFGIVNFIIICTKTYDLKNVLEKISPSIDKNTILLTLLNGTNNAIVVQEKYPDNFVLNGCVYIVSRLIKPGLIENSGNIQSIYFGKDNYQNENLKHLEKLFNMAKIEAKCVNNISQIIWEKFIFLSPIATATTIFNKTIGELLLDKECFGLITCLIEEVKKMAEARRILLPPDITEKTIAKLKSLPYQTTTSMHSDFKGNKLKTELDSLTSYVISEGIKYNIKTPNYLAAMEKITRNYKLI